MHGRNYAAAGAKAIGQANAENLVPACRHKAGIGVYVWFKEEKSLKVTKNVLTIGNVGHILSYEAVFKNVGSVSRGAETRNLISAVLVDGLNDMPINEGLILPEAIIGRYGLCRQEEKETDDGLIEDEDALICGVSTVSVGLQKDKGY